MKILMTNACVFLKNDALQEDVMGMGIHLFLDFEAIIATDSGSYQLMRYGSVLTNNKFLFKLNRCWGLIGQIIQNSCDLWNFTGYAVSDSVQQFPINFHGIGGHRIQ